jgi:hypothetical protein
MDDLQKQALEHYSPLILVELKNANQNLAEGDFAGARANLRRAGTYCIDAENVSRRQPHGSLSRGRRWEGDFTPVS